MHEDIKYLSVKLPEDIEKLKWYGDFERALKVIDLRLQKEIPTALRKRLELEKEILRRLPETYIYTREDALKILKVHIRGFMEEELEQLRDEDALDWIYIQGQVMFKDNFLSNLIKTREAYAKRVLNRDMLAGGMANAKLLDDTIKRMKEQGSAACRMHIKTSLEVKPEAVRQGESLKVHLPIPIEYAQVRHFRILGTSPEPIQVADADDFQRTVFFEEAARDGQEYFVEYEFENHTTYVETKAQDVWAEQPVFDTEEQLPHIRFTPYIASLLEEVVGEETNPLRKARRIYDFITTKVMYSFVRPYTAITDIAEYTATGLKGDCGLQALLFITMCRAAKIPARWQAGLYSTPLDIGCHDWAQFYVAPYGWLYADCSFGGSAYRAGALERWDFYFGNLDPFRVPMASRFQHEFAPPKKYMRDDPYDNQTGEAEYETCGLVGTDYKTKQTLMSIELIEEEEV